MNFPTDLTSIEERMKSIDPVAYSSSRNFKNGTVTGLSPYISRGVISTKHVFDYLLEQDLAWKSIEKLVQELAWRDYWQQVWLHIGDEINSDIRGPQVDVVNTGVSKAIIDANTTITAIDEGIEELYQTGYMHNHMRMYVASLACNLAKSHWKNPAQWMYAHLLDGDWASNALSWQWVAGTNANKKYLANQENINKYFESEQQGSYLDHTYDTLPLQPIPSELNEFSKFNMTTVLPKTDKVFDLNPSLDTAVYNYYNLDPYWRKEDLLNRVLLLEPAFFKKYPVSQKCIDFVLDLSENIDGIQVFVGSFSELEKLSLKQIIYKEHPTNQHYAGIEEPRDWMFEVTGNFRSFFAFWKKCLKSLKTQ